MQKSLDNLICTSTSIFEHCAYSYVVHCTDTAPYIYIQQNSAELCSWYRPEISYRVTMVERKKAQLGQKWRQKVKKFGGAQSI